MHRSLYPAGALGSVLTRMETGPRDRCPGTAWCPAAFGITGDVSPGGMMIFISYLLKISIGTILIFLTVRIVDRGNSRNTSLGAFITALVLTLSGAYPAAFGVALLIWCIVLMGVYQIDLPRSALCVLIYGLFHVLISAVAAMFLYGAELSYVNIRYMDFLAPETGELKRGAAFVLDKMPRDMLKKLGMEDMDVPVMNTAGESRPFYRFNLNNGRSINGVILMEGEKGYLVDIAKGRSEVVVRKDQLVSIQEI